MLKKVPLGPKCISRDVLGHHETLDGLLPDAGFDQIALSFNSFRGYLVSRHSIPPPASVVDADLSMA